MSNDKMPKCCIQCPHMACADVGGSFCGLTFEGFFWDSDGRFRKGFDPDKERLPDCPLPLASELR